MDVRDLKGIRGMGKLPIMMNNPTSGLGSFFKNKKKGNTMPKVKPPRKFGPPTQDTSVSVTKPPFVSPYRDIPYNQMFWARFDPAPNITPQQMHELYLKHGHPTQSEFGGFNPFDGSPTPNPRFDPTDESIVFRSPFGS